MLSESLEEAKQEEDELNALMKDVGDDFSITTKSKIGKKQQDQTNIVPNKLPG